MKRILQKESGITLVALVVTIIVLLILAAISLNLVLGENGIISRAKEASQKTSDAAARETVDMLVNDYIIARDSGIDSNDLESYLTEKKNNGEIQDVVDNGDETLTVKVNGHEIVIEKTPSSGEVVSRDGIAVGDYMNYSPDDKSTTPYASLNLENTGTTSNTSINQETLKWRVLRIYNDGSMDLIGSPTTQEIYIKGDIAYSKGVTVLNNVCKSLYSRSSAGITARSVNINDFENCMTTVGKQKRTEFQAYDGGPFYGKTQTYTEPTKRFYVNVYAQEIGSNIDSGKSGLVAGINQETGKANGINQSAETNINGITCASSSLTVTETFYAMYNINANMYGEAANVLYDDTEFWLASRSNNCEEDYSCFIMRYAGNKLDGECLYHSDNNAYERHHTIRPVVKLNKNVKITISENASTNPNAPHQITKY